MIDVERLRQDPDGLAAAVGAKGVTDVDIPALRALDSEWRALLADIEQERHALHESERAVNTKRAAAREELIGSLRTRREALQRTEERLAGMANERERLLQRLPNPPLPSVPRGRDQSENRVVSETPRREFSFSPKSYLELGTTLGLIDVERSARASGTRFAALLGDAALLEFALVRFAFGNLAPQGFVPIVPPVLVRREGLAAMGYLERGEEEVYRTQDDLSLVGTSEQSIGAMHAGAEFHEDTLPRRFVAFSTCFRREAGSYGKDTKGLLRVHQFDKVEMFSFCHPASSEAEHEQFLRFQRELLDQLEIPYRVVQLCTGDLGNPAAATWDLESWLPGSKEYRETHSTTNTTDFQTRRLGVIVRDRAGGRQLAHAVNGTAFAIGRTIAAIFENHQRADGLVAIPSVLRPFFGDRDTLASGG